MRRGEPQSEQWRAGRDALKGYRVLKLGLNPPRTALYGRIDDRAKQMFANGLVEETRALREQFGDNCRALGSLGYAQASSVLRAEIAMTEAIAAAQQGHRNYAKRQLTWFRRDKEIHWIAGFGDDSIVQADVLKLARAHVTG